MAFMLWVFPSLLVTDSLGVVAQSLHSQLFDNSGVSECAFNCWSKMLALVERMTG